MFLFDNRVVYFVSSPPLLKSQAHERSGRSPFEKMSFPLELVVSWESHWEVCIECVLSLLFLSRLNPGLLSIQAAVKTEDQRQVESLQQLLNKGNNSQSDDRRAFLRRWRWSGTSDLSWKEKKKKCMTRRVEMKRSWFLFLILRNSTLLSPSSSCSRFFTFDEEFLWSWHESDFTSFCQRKEGKKGELVFFASASLFLSFLEGLEKMTKTREEILSCNVMTKWT